ncbi:hypothetical protein IU450_02705 [Nocardia abscessus]|uniref:hypothetical protein n=1 Tax=Nocardia abscessus TaxID=120957 RepID=UPI00189304AB|nr:hypothetical protein [Nocardia abscessus]MBF6334790.1 hypothetical protein [Nocardia abscessus]
MKFEKITAAVFMAISAVGITAATAHAESAVTEQPTVVTVGDRVLATAAENGQFEITQNGAVALGSGDAVVMTEVPQLEDISSYDRLKEQINKNLPGVVGGAVVGGLLGACMPLIWGVSVPVGALIGGTVGGYAMGGPEFLDAVQAFVANQGR